MLHVTCDLCGKELGHDDDQRYVVKIEIYSARDPGQITEDDLDEDHMEAISAVLRDEMDDLMDPSAIEPACRSLRYDLCCDCQKKFVKDPLSRETDRSFDFSEN